MISSPECQLVGENVYMMSSILSFIQSYIFHIRKILIQVERIRREVLLTIQHARCI